MSSNEDTKTDLVRQVDSSKKPETDQTIIQRLAIEALSLTIQLLKIGLLLISESVAAKIGKRLSQHADAATLPETGFGDVLSVAAYLGLSEMGAYKLINRIPNLPKYKPGTAVFVRYEDLARLCPQGSIADQDIDAT